MQVNRAAAALLTSCFLYICMLINSYVVQCDLRVNSLAVKTAQEMLRARQRGPLPADTEVVSEACSPDRRGRALYLAGFLHMFRHDYASAIRMFAESRQVRRDDQFACLQQGFAMTAMGESAASESIWRDCRLATYFSTIGHQALLQNDLDKATRYLILSTELDSTYGQAHLWLGHTLLRAGNSSGAAKAFKEAIRLGMDSLELHYLLASALVQIHEYEQARIEALKVIGLNPLYPWGYVMMGNTYRLEKQYDRAETWFRRLAEVDGESSLALIYLSITEVDQGNAEAALAYLDKASTKASPKQLAEIHFWRGQAYSLMRDGRALDELVEATQQDPTSVVFLLALADLYMDLRNPEQAWDVFRRVLALDPANLEAQRGLKEIQVVQ